MPSTIRLNRPAPVRGAPPCRSATEALSLLRGVEDVNARALEALSEFCAAVEDVALGSPPPYDELSSLLTRAQDSAKSLLKCMQHWPSLNEVASDLADHWERLQLRTSDLLESLRLVIACNYHYPRPPNWDWKLTTCTSQLRASVTALRNITAGFSKPSVRVSDLETHEELIRVAHREMVIAAADFIESRSTNRYESRKSLVPLPGLPRCLVCKSMLKRGVDALPIGEVARILRRHWGEGGKSLTETPRFPLDYAVLTDEIFHAQSTLGYHVVTLQVFNQATTDHFQVVWKMRETLRSSPRVHFCRELFQRRGFSHLESRGEREHYAVRTTAREELEDALMFTLFCLPQLRDVDLGRRTPSAEQLIDSFEDYSRRIRGLC